MFTLEDVREAALRALDETGDHVYKRPDGKSCFYATPQGEPSCIVGYVFHKIDRTTFNEERKRERRHHTSRSAGSVLDEKFDEYTPMADAWLRVVQGYQDSGMLWSQAIRKADEDVVYDSRSDSKVDDPEYVVRIREEYYQRVSDQRANA